MIPEGMIERSLFFPDVFLELLGHLAGIEIAHEIGLLAFAANLLEDLAFAISI